MKLNQDSSYLHEYTQTTYQDTLKPLPLQGKNELYSDDIMFYM